jgi:predicted dithiol-disulfide oxidoreductase (DUF899 family)
MTTLTFEKSAAKVVPHEEWVSARKQFLIKEKEFTRLRDELSRQRRELPWEKVEKKYVFEGPNGKEALQDLFDGRHQLMIYHFMFAPGWGEGCQRCSFSADGFDSAALHLAQRDTAFAVVSRAPSPEIETFKKRMGWKFKWLSSFGTDFNYDYQVSESAEEKASGKTYYNYEPFKFPVEELPGMSVFFKRDSAVFHTYSTYARGLDILVPTYNLLDLTAKGRDEEGLTDPMSWVRYHDRYSDGKLVDLTAQTKKQA